MRVWLWTQLLSDRSHPVLEEGTVVKKRLSMTEVLDGDLLTKDGMLKPTNVNDRSAPRVEQDQPVRKRPSMVEILDGDLLTKDGMLKPVVTK
jgi:hypothetical protein